MADQINLYETTLRDGTQGEQVNLSAEDKLRICRKLDDFGIQYIEGGWPKRRGKNPLPNLSPPIQPMKSGLSG